MTPEEICRLMQFIIRTGEYIEDDEEMMKEREALYEILQTAKPEVTP